MVNRLLRQVRQWQRNNMDNGIDYAKLNYSPGMASALNGISGKSPEDTSQNNPDPFYGKLAYSSNMKGVLDSVSQAVNPDDVAKAMADSGDQSFDGYCQAFAEKMTGAPNMGGSAAEAWNNYSKQGRAVPSVQGMNPGDLIYFAPDNSNQGYGHVGIYQGDGKFVSATYHGVQSNDLSDWQKKTGQQIVGYVPQGGIHATQP